MPVHAKTRTGARDQDQGPGTRGRGPGTGDRGPGIRDQGPGTRDQGPGTGDQGPGTRDQGPGTRDPPHPKINFSSKIGPPLKKSIFLSGKHIYKNFDFFTKKCNLLINAHLLGDMLF